MEGDRLLATVSFINRQFTVFSFIKLKELNSSEQVYFNLPCSRLTQQIVRISGQFVTSLLFYSNTGILSVTIGL
jgi:hypothetical protein